LKCILSSQFSRHSRNTDETLQYWVSFLYYRLFDAILRNLACIFCIKVWKDTFMNWEGSTKQFTQYLILILLWRLQIAVIRKVFLICHNCQILSYIWCLFHSFSYFQVQTKDYLMHIPLPSIHLFFEGLYVFIIANDLSSSLRCIGRIYECFTTKFSARSRCIGMHFNLLS